MSYSLSNGISCLFAHSLRIALNMPRHSRPMNASLFIRNCPPDARFSLFSHILIFMRCALDSLHLSTSNVYGGVSYIVFKEGSNYSIWHEIVIINVFIMVKYWYIEPGVCWHKSAKFHKLKPLVVWEKLSGIHIWIGNVCDLKKWSYQILRYSKWFLKFVDIVMFWWLFQNHLIGAW